MQAQNRVGHELGNYRLMKLLGRGGFAEVYLAENKYLGVQTAIKVLKLRDLDPLEQEKFRVEAKYMTTLEHPHIIKVLDYGIEMSQRGSGVDGSTPYLVMEYAPLGTLRHLYSQRDVMPLPKVTSYTKQIAEALQYAHDKNIIHLDVKPENMLVRKPDDVALSDFGIAVTGFNTGNLQEQQAEILQMMARGEQIAIPGTAQYLAPERLHGHKQRASDQYSLAVVVYEWLCG
ncbi:MAG TPA: serine/threonine-protein kinase, partial [Ktedonobacteraceae bacterium]|nr:serine/threonine-protein kinase [Ktedonobacteraceae bacterium]